MQAVNQKLDNHLEWPSSAENPCKISDSTGATDA